MAAMLSDHTWCKRSCWVPTAVQVSKLRENAHELGDRQKLRAAIELAERQLLAYNQASVPKRRPFCSSTTPWSPPLPSNAMKTPFLLTFLFMGSLGLTALGKEKSEFIPIFNGKDLDGWDAKADCWEVRNCEIWCTGKSEEKNWLIWRKEQPANFILRLEFRWDKGNSGIQVRSDDLGKWQICGYQVEVATQDKMGLWHHSLLDGKHPKKKARHLMATAGQHVTLSPSGEKSVKQLKDANQIKMSCNDHAWNTMEIVARGDTLVQKINGVVFSTVTDRDSEMSRKSGFIALQDHGKGCVAAFRNIRLKKLPNTIATKPSEFTVTHLVTAEEFYYLDGPQQARAPDGKFKKGTRVQLVQDSGSYSVVVSESGIRAYVSTASLKPVE